ncbi:MAG TPA: potassium/proton antiporter [Kofleriaceae bacterium]|nr:potassium/proton antiporter [Kofleriaceae bacterium]
MPAEPATTALVLLIFGGLFALSAILSRTLGRVGIPVVLLFLLLGMIAGSEGIGLIAFDNHRVAFQLGTVALALILFDGGLNTSMDVVRDFAVPAGILATAGVIATAFLLAIAARLFGFAWGEALILGAIVSSTDAAAVFSVLRGTGLHLPRRLGGTLELESGLNDPMAVILTFTLTESFIEPGGPGFGVVLRLLLQLVVGAGLGIAFGLLGRMVIRRTRPLVGGLFPMLTVSVAFVAFGVPTLLMGSGFLAVYTAGIVLGDAALPFRNGLLRVHDFLAWLSQVVMFLSLGLLVFPSDLLEVFGVGLALAAFLAFVARPIAVALCLFPLRFPARTVGFIGWVGLRGAVPIILASFPILAGAPGAHHIFNVIFFVVVVSALVQGGSLRWVTRWLGFEEKVPPAAPALLEITSTKLLRGEIMSFYIEPISAVCGAPIADIPFPAEAAVMLIIRGETLIAPKGQTELSPGDHVYVFCRPEDRPFIHLLFAHEENPA